MSAWNEHKNLHKNRYANAASSIEEEAEKSEIQLSFLNLWIRRDKSLKQAHSLALSS